MTDQSRQLARDMVRLEAQARHDQLYQYSAAYWLTTAWLQREQLRELRSGLLRVEWAERRLVRA